MNQYRLELVYSKEVIAHKVKELASRISDDYRGKEPILIGVLKGVFIFFADLVRNLEIPIKIDFVRLKSYGDQDKSPGKVEIKKAWELPLKGKDVIVIEDIIDTGITLDFLLDRLRQDGVNSLKVCTLIDKKSRKVVEIDASYIGFELKEDLFVVGYGMDFAEEYRFLPEIFHIQTS